MRAGADMRAGPVTPVAEEPGWVFGINEALERIGQSDAVKRLRMDVDPEAAKECGRLAEQVRRSGVAEYTPIGAGRK